MHLFSRVLLQVWEKKMIQLSVLKLTGDSSRFKKAEENFPLEVGTLWDLPFHLEPFSLSYSLAGASYILPFEAQYSFSLG